jgi:hypothetical protein
MIGISKDATGVIKHLTKDSLPQKAGGVSRFFRKIVSGKTKSTASQFQVPKDEWVKSHADNLAAIKADTVHFQNAARQNKQQLARETRALSQQPSPDNVSQQTVKPQAKSSPEPQNVTAQALEANQPKPTAQRTAELETRLARLSGVDPGKPTAQRTAELETRLARLSGVDPGKPTAQRTAELETRLARLSGVDLSKPTAQRTAELNSRLARLNAVSPQAAQAETRRLKALERIHQTRKEIMADTQLTKTQRRQQLAGLNKILKDYT